MKRVLAIALSILIITGCSKNDSPSSTDTTTTVKITISGQQSVYTGSTTTSSSNGATLSVETQYNPTYYKLVGMFGGQNTLFLDFKASSPLTAKTYALDNVTDYLFIVNGTKYQ